MFLFHINTELDNHQIIISVALLSWSYLVMKKSILLWKKKNIYKKKINKLNSTTRCCTIEKHSTRSYVEIYLEALPFWVTPKSTAISYLSFTAWWLNKQDNNNNNVSYVYKSVYPHIVKCIYLFGIKFRTSWHTDFIISGVFIILR